MTIESRNASAIQPVAEVQDERLESLPWLGPRTLVVTYLQHSNVKSDTVKFVKKQSTRRDTRIVCQAAMPHRKLK